MNGKAATLLQAATTSTYGLWKAATCNNYHAYAYAYGCTLSMLQQLKFMVAMMHQYSWSNVMTEVIQLTLPIL